LVGLCLTSSTVLFTVLYLRKIDAGFAREAALLGIAFLCANLVLDLCIFMWGPMKMSFSNYMMDIGFAYFGMPIISIGLGYSLDSHRSPAMRA
jgi:hypothetical protein